MSTPKENQPPAQQGCGTPPAPSNKAWMRYLETATGKQTAYSTTSKFASVVYLVVDCSGSMADLDKMAQARRGAVGFAKQAQQKGYSVGVIRFESSAQRIVTAQTSIKELETCVARMNVGGSTNLAEGIHLAAQCLLDEPGERVMCVITDGYPDDVNAALSAARQAAVRNIDIMALGTDDADEDFLQRLVTRKELQAKVSGTQLEQGMVAMVKLLPGPGDAR